MLWGRVGVVTAGTLLGSWLPWLTLAKARSGLESMFHRWEKILATPFRLWSSPSSVVGCFPGVQAVTVDMLAVEVARIQTWVWERQDGCMVWVRVKICRCSLSYILILRGLRTTTQFLIAQETDRPVSIPTTREQRAVFLAQDWSSYWEVRNH